MSIPATPLQAITGNETLLVLAAHPGDESALCGGLIAQSCRRGRPPFVMVLGDGSASDPIAPDPAALAQRHERETRAAAACLGLPPGRLLMVGLFDPALAAPSPPVFDAIVRAVALVMWARDCNAVCAPAPTPDANPSPGHAAAHRIAAVVAERTGVAHLSYAAPPGPHALHLDITDQRPAKHAAIAAHTGLGPEAGVGTSTELLQRATPQ